jgi:DNA-binding NtrC family response regulator
MTNTALQTILLVEDEQCLRALSAVFLRRQGYQVLEASLPGEAISIAQKHDGEIQLLLTDVTLPGMDGHLLAQQIQVLRPNIKVLYVSGYPQESLQAFENPPADFSFMEKPFALQALGMKIREMLNLSENSPAAEMLAAG